MLLKADMKGLLDVILRVTDFKACAVIKTNKALQFYCLSTEL